jgi:hypothetical protein
MPATPEELINQLAELPNYPYPEALIEEMIQRREEIIPALLAVIEDAGKRPKHYINHSRWKTLDFAAYLLAQFRETRAFKPLCATLGHPAKVTDELWGDIITEDMGRILASVFDGDDAPLRDLMRNRKAYEFVRGAAVPKTYLCLLGSGKISREELETYTEELLSNGLEREPSYAWDGWAGLCADLGFARLVPFMEKAFEDDLCDPSVYGFDEMLQDAASKPKDAWKRDAGLIDDTIKETKWWNCWSKPVKPKKVTPDTKREALMELPAVEQLPQLAEPRTGAKIGRNDPCPCASGKKYKKCCGAFS